MSKTYLIYGDYEEDVFIDRCDYKILAFREADSPGEAFRSWLNEVKGNISLFEKEVIIREVSGERTCCYLEKKDEK
jgi:hypothetical protein